jgi:hypothetical protein
MRSDGSPEPGDGDVKAVVRDKIIHYRQVYLDRPDPITFMTLAVDTSGRIYDDFGITVREKPSSEGLECWSHLFVLLHSLTQGVTWWKTKKKLLNEESWTTEGSCLRSPIGYMETKCLGKTSEVHGLTSSGSLKKMCSMRLSSVIAKPLRVAKTKHIACCKEIGDCP